jgi:hypothetical protein
MMEGYSPPKLRTAQYHSPKANITEKAALRLLFLEGSCKKDAGIPFAESVLRSI